MDCFYDIFQDHSRVVPKIFLNYFEIFCKYSQFMITIPFVRYLMRTCLSIYELQPHYVWARCATNFEGGLKSPRITPVRYRSQGDSASVMSQRAMGRNLTLKYFVNNCCNRLKSSFQSLQYLVYMSRCYAKSRTFTTRPTHNSQPKNRTRNLLIATVHQFMARTVQLISGVLATDRRVHLMTASTGSRTTSH